MTEIPPRLKEAQALLDRVKSLLKEKKAFEETSEYQEAQKIVKEVEKVVDKDTDEKFMDKDPVSAIMRLKEAKKLLEKLG